MPYNEKLSDRVREMLAATPNKLEEIKMFSGICFMVNDKMCAGVQKDQLMLRLDPAIIEQVLEEEGCTPMDMKGKVMKSFVLVDQTALTTKRKLEYWLRLALDYNPVAKASKRKNS
ncbi:MAG: TfoX family protein [Ferruginibacter sp.]|nr:TfoX family protein [Ferruginibacter sp.]